MDDRLFISNLYTNPAFKAKWWLDEDIYSEQTPLSTENIKHFLDKYCPHSDVYSNFEDYLTHCKYKSIAPQVVGLEPIDHWVAVEKHNRVFRIIDSSGAPRQAYTSLTITALPKNIEASEQGHIRQSPKSNACGIYAAFYCVGEELYHDGLYFWKSYAPNVVSYSPVTIDVFNRANKIDESDYWLHQNDISMFRHFKMMY